MANQNQKPHNIPAQVEEVKRQPTLRLKSNAIAFVNTHPQPRGLTSIKQLKSMFANAFKRTEDEMMDDLDSAKKSAKTEENMKKIKKIFSNLNRVIAGQEETVINQMEGMPLDQQEAVALYWEGVQKLISEILDGLYEQFLQTLERIKRGEKLDKKALRAYFDEIYEAFKIMFTPEKYIMVDQNPVQQHANDQYVNNHQYNHQNNDGAVGYSYNDPSGSNPRNNRSNDGNFDSSNFSFESGKLQKGKSNNSRYEVEDNCQGRNSYMPPTNYSQN